MLIKKEIIINSDVKKVWKVFCELENWPKWGYYILNAKWLSNKKWERGSKFVQVVKRFGIFNEIKSKSVILNVIPTEYTKWSGTRKLVRGVHSLQFIKAGKKTKVVNTEYFEGLLAPFIFPFIKKNFEMYFEQFNKGLKNEVEK